ncbi:MAG: hypothetical protein BroJett021_35380 [Chloroflexota bacterium]|nr:MAG: hypothetical protein BroJett021_35380 [Chloroflexota bacterium]
MKFGDEVTLIRGSRGRGAESGPGFERRLRARYVGARKNMVRCILLEDDPHATVPPYKAGDAGWWHGRSFVEKKI